MQQGKGIRERAWTLRPYAATRKTRNILQRRDVGPPQSAHHRSANVWKRVKVHDLVVPVLLVSLSHGADKSVNTRQASTVVPGEGEQLSCEPSRFPRVGSASGYVKRSGFAATASEERLASAGVGPSFFKQRWRWAGASAAWSCLSADFGSEHTAGSPETGGF